MDSGSDTPEGFLHETKFVVLSYLGLVPPDFDPGFSEFDNRSSGGSSYPHTPFSINGSEEGSHSTSPRFLSVKSRYGLRSQSSISPSSAKSKSPALSPRGSQRKQRTCVKVDHDVVHTTVDTVTQSGAKGHLEVDTIEDSVEISKVDRGDKQIVEVEKVKVQHDEIHASVDLITTSETGGHIDVNVIEDSVEIYESSPGNGVGDDAEGDDDIETDCEEVEGTSNEEDECQETGASNIGGDATVITTVETTDTVEALLPLQTGAAPEINILTPSPTVPTKPPAGSGDSPKLIIPPPPGSGQSSGSSSSEIGKVSSDSDSVFLGVDDSWSGRKRKSIEELTEPLREELQEAFNQLGLEKEYFDVVCRQDGSASSDSPTVIPPICPIAREAIVAERIAQIGDMIMESHKEELEAAMAQVFGETAKGGNINYTMFRSMVQHMVRSAAPEWYHLALMLNFTRRMAFGFLRRGNQSMGYLSDYAVRYIEEHLAETIIENGGWDAMVNINPEDISDEISSRSISPMPPDSLSHGSSPMPSSPIIIKESPVDPPLWQHTTSTHVHITTVSQSDAGVNVQVPNSQSETIKSTKSTTCNSSVPRTFLNRTDPNLQSASSDIPSTNADGTVQTTSDQSGGSFAVGDHTQVDSTVVDGGESKGISHYLLATAAGAAAAAGAVYALMKK